MNPKRPTQNIIIKLPNVKDKETNLTNSRRTTSFVQRNPHKTVRLFGINFAGQKRMEHDIFKVLKENNSNKRLPTKKT